MRSKVGLQLPGPKTLLTAICISLFLLLLCTRSNYQLLEARFGSHQRLVPSVALGRLDSGSGIASAVIASVSRFITSTEDGKPLDSFELPLIDNYTQKYLALIEQNGSKSCHDVATSKVLLFGLPNPNKGDSYIKLKCGPVHKLTLVAFDHLGRKRCAGGDYFETDISGSHWKSRALVVDLEDGSYSVLLQIHPHFAGVYEFKIILGFSNYHALEQSPGGWFRNETIVHMHIQFMKEEESSPVGRVVDLPQCRREDFQRDAWTGRWVRSKHSRNCNMDKRGRFRCLDTNASCIEPWCRGPIAALESNGWVYSAHCAFRIFSVEDAWKCIDRKWLFFWGDSNHVDSVRNLLNFVLGFENVTWVPRRFDALYYRQANSSQFVRITNIYNGHSNDTMNFQGLFSLHDEALREQIAAYFQKGTAPDALILNSGLHDGVQWKDLHQFAEQGADKATEFWASLLNGVQGRKPRVIYRTTIASAAWARGAPFNPQKMEVFNAMLVEKFKKANLLWGVVDGFDLTYPWHFDYGCSDGLHYGRPPDAGNWYGRVGHQYFVDLMLLHMLMHAICIS